jgi:hypothetical protein
MKFYIIILSSFLVACGGGSSETSGDTDGESTLPKLETNLFIKGASSDDKPDTMKLDSFGNIIIQGDTTGSADGQSFIGGFEDYFLIKYNSTGQKLWTKQLGSADNDMAGGITIDSANNIISVGSTNGFISPASNNGGYDCFMQKFDASGTTIWTKLIGTSENDFCEGVEVDGDDNLYVVGTSWGDLGGDINSGNSDAFIAKFDKDGNQIWIELLGCDGFDFFNGLSVNVATGMVYVTGDAQNDLNDCSTINGPSDVVTAGFNLDGDLQWLSMFDGSGTTGTDWGWAIVSAESGDTFITGQVDDGTSPDQSFVISYDPGGNLRWNQIYQDSNYDIGQSIALDGNDNILVAILAEGQISSVTNTLGDDSAYVVRLDQDGSEIDVYYFNYGIKTLPRSLAVDDDNDIYVFSQTDDGTDKNSVISRFDENGVLQSN